jgi:uncharacterized phage protein (TIGR01671 family)
MSRELKFRAWDERRKCIVNPSCDEDSRFTHYVSVTDEGLRWITVFEPTYNEWMLCGNQSTEYQLKDIMQFTGLLDKNGVEIYEGDIVREHKMMFDLEKPEGEDVYYEYRTGEIEYLGHSYWVSEEYIGFEGEGLWDWNQLEIIGNRFQNPELLQK